jgi:hypothetical protein
LLILFPHSHSHTLPEFVLDEIEIVAPKEFKFSGNNFDQTAEHHFSRFE